MSPEVHPAATPHLPFFTPQADGSDVLMTMATISLVLSVLGIGLLFFHVHTLPERMAHKSKKLQVELVAVLGLLSLFSQQHIFWVMGLLLAFIDLPDVGTPVRRAVRALETLANIEPPKELDQDQRDLSEMQEKRHA